ncbi:hypothetical protein PHLCEN_2v11515 [Hermanssonia centrifuga]|uniref:Uncharacterized protein n=1 Tax=Hermanssonia centrifuga TaxID=98765 RepID=A0A2R6NJZ6_9APHY|nr:hypothetical protein PHLCEN_2v11515 [Hermanssonia centrifuga]
MALLGVIALSSLLFTTDTKGQLTVSSIQMYTITLKPRRIYTDLSPDSRETPGGTRTGNKTSHS